MLCACDCQCNALKVYAKLKKIFCHSYETVEHMGKKKNRQIRQFDWLGGEIHTYFAIQNIKLMFWKGGRFSNLFDILCGSLVFLRNYEKYLIFVSTASYTLPSNKQSHFPPDLINVSLGLELTWNSTNLFCSIN